MSTDPMSQAHPYRGRFGDPRPPAWRELPLPPAPMPSHDGARPLKAWRYVGVYGPELMLCLGAVRIGRARQTFWAVWDRARGRLLERTTLRPRRARPRTRRVPAARPRRPARPRARGGTRDRDGVPERRELRLDAQAGRYPRPRDGDDRRSTTVDRRTGRDRRHRGLLRAAHALALVGGSRTRAGRPGGGVEPRRGRQRPTGAQRAHGVG